MKGQMDKWMDGISPHSTGLCPLSEPLPYYPLRLHNNKEAGKGNRWPYDAFWRPVLVRFLYWQRYFLPINHYKTLHPPNTGFDVSTKEEKKGDKFLNKSRHLFSIPRLASSPFVPSQAIFIKARDSAFKVSFHPVFEHLLWDFAT